MNTARPLYEGSTGPLTCAAAGWPGQAARTGGDGDENEAANERPPPPRRSFLVVAWGRVSAR